MIHVRQAKQPNRTDEPTVVNIRQRLGEYIESSSFTPETQDDTLFSHPLLMLLLHDVNDMAVHKENVRYCLLQCAQFNRADLMRSIREWFSYFDHVGWSRALLRAIQCSHITPVKYIVRNELCVIDMQHLVEAVRMQQLEVLELLYLHNRVSLCLMSKTHEMVNAAIEKDWIDGLRWLQFHSTPLDRVDFTTFAAYSGSIECLRFLLVHKCPVSEDAVTWAQKQYDILRDVREYPGSSQVQRQLMAYRECLALLEEAKEGNVPFVGSKTEAKSVCSLCCVIC